MAENAGRIEYQFAAETDGILKAGTVVDKTTDKMVQDFNKVDKSVKNFNTQTTRASQGVRRAFGSNLGQAGIQVQQFVGQLQGGQSAMVALAQQSADLGIVLGAPLIGVFVSLAAVLAGTLAPAIFGSVSNIEKLQKAIENTKAIMTLGKNGIIEYTDEMKRLETASESLAKIKIALAITENTNALKSSRKEFTALRAELFGFQEDSDEAAKRLTGMTDKTGDVLDLASALESFSNAVTDESKLKQLERAESILLDMRNANGEFPTKDLSAFAQEFFTLSDATRQAISNNQALKKSNEDLDTSAGTTGESFNKLRIGLKEQTIALQDGERAAFKYSLLMSGEYTAAQIEAALKIYDTNAALIEQKKASEENSKALEAEIDAYIKIGDEAVKAAEKKEAAAQREKERLGQRGTVVGLTEVQSVEMRYESDLEALKAAREQQLITNQEYDMREIELNRQKQEAIRQSQSETNDFMKDAFGNLDTQIAGTLGNIVLGARGGKDALKDLARTILTQVVGAIIKQGIASATAAATAATATTAANAAIATSAAPAAALTSLASFGGNAAPAIAGIAAVMALPAIAGGRQYGGAVSQGMYRVNETGTPEIYSHGGKDYLMNTKNANIKPLEQGGGGSGWSVNVENYGPDKVYTTIDDVNMAVKIGIGREAGKAAKGQGSLLKGLQKGTNLQRNARN